MSIAVSDRLAAVLASRSFTLSCRTTITRGGQLLAADLPVDVGREECDATLRVPERVELTLPKRVDGFDWEALGLESPIMPFGQRVHIKLGVGVGSGRTEWINRGEFLLHSVDLAGPSVKVVAVGLLALVQEAGLVAPYKPTGTMLSTLRRLVEPALTVRLHPDVADRAVVALTIDSDRLAAVTDLLKAWPARGQVTPDGVLYVSPADDSDLTELGTGMYVQRRHMDDNTHLRPNVQDVSTGATRDGVVNTIVVRGQTAAGAAVTGVAYDRSGGPASYGGPFNPLPVPEYFNHGTVRSAAIARAVAQALLKQRRAPFQRSWQIRGVPQPRFLLGDRLKYLPGPGFDDSADVRVERLTMPYTAASGAMEMTLREIE